MQYLSCSYAGRVSSKKEMSNKLYQSFNMSRKIILHTFFTIEKVKRWDVRKSTDHKKFHSKYEKKYLRVD